jgi:hypothetical protein
MRLPQFSAEASLGSAGRNFISASAQSGSSDRGVVTPQFDLRSCPPGMGPVECCLLNGGRMECHRGFNGIHCQCVG